jgi:hypothetical protein
MSKKHRLQNYPEKKKEPQIDSVFTKLAWSAIVGLALMVIFLR